MPHYYSTSSFDRSHALLPLVPGAGFLPRLPAWERLEHALVQALDAVGQFAGLLWWDGSALGLHLNGFAGLIDPDEGESARVRREPGR